MRPSRLVPLVVACALFMENLDSAVIATSLPVIAADLTQDPIALKLAPHLVPHQPCHLHPRERLDGGPLRRAHDLSRGDRRVHGGLARLRDVELARRLRRARFLQGMGGAMMVPVGRLLILRAVSKSELVSALAYLTVPALIGPVAGPPVGGFITTYFDWRWIFLINIPIGIVGIVLATVYFENVREPDPPPLDFLGFVLLGFGLAALMLGLATGGRHLLPLSASIAAAVAGAVSVGLYLLRSRRVSAPVLKLELLRIPTFRQR
jgi:MFS family permease